MSERVGTVVGTVRQLYIYPVKSMRGMAVEQACVSLNGIYGDRRYAFVQKGCAATDSFPWMTGREQPRMITYQPAVARLPTFEDADPPVNVQTPDGDVFEVSDPRLRARVERDAQTELFLIKNGRGNYDSQHLSIFNLFTLSALEAESGASIDPRQFRANLYVESTEAQAFAEEGWLGHVLQIGTAVVAITKKDTRCMMINLEPRTGRQQPNVLRTVTRLHNQQAGVYANVMSPGVVRPGDVLRVLATTKAGGDAD